MYYFVDVLSSGQVKMWRIKLGSQRTVDVAVAVFRCSTGAINLEQ
jgi:hypothetical protein